MVETFGVSLSSLKFLDVIAVESNYSEGPKFGSHPGGRIHQNTNQCNTGMTALAGVHKDKVGKPRRKQALAAIRSMPDTSQFYDLGTIVTAVGMAQWRGAEERLLNLKRIFLAGSKTSFESSSRGQGTINPAKKITQDVEEVRWVFPNRQG
ncbi:hypothetical protein DSO57_1009924 [Entomophthora muscae]|uniref:Uncharacterized protein n=1 Tax=Entomophthora muscae TaxID=34485 RepID=A0ACC2SVQ2_9FUNG|nr:hypothetical protein DSO57_1009924 [Entomophthora muscae]